jgi:hypothetical protein
MSDLVLSVLFVLGHLCCLGAEREERETSWALLCLLDKKSAFKEAFFSSKKFRSPLSLISPDHFFIWVNMIPNALFESFLLETSPFTKVFIFGSLPSQSLAKKRSKILFFASGASQESMGFFLPSLAFLPAGTL